jgi:hypothetical protein
VLEYPPQNQWRLMLAMSGTLLGVMAEVADSGDVMLEASTSASNEFMNSKIFQRGMGDYQYASVSCSSFDLICAILATP